MSVVFRSQSGRHRTSFKGPRCRARCAPLLEAQAARVVLLHLLSHKKMTKLGLGTRMVLAALLLEAGERLVVEGADRDRTSIWFPRERAPSTPVISRNSAERAAAAAPLPHTREIPLDFLLQLSDVQNDTYFMENYVDSNSYTDNVSADSLPDIINRFGSPDERKSTQSAKPALCEPQLEVVPLIIPTDPSLFYYPTCTRIERCGGCCGSTLLKCQPTDTEIVNFKIIVTQYTGAKQMKYKGNEVVSLERHIECKCDCAVQESNCTKFQEYRKNECQCVCINKDDQQKCLSQSDVKVWDSSMCNCLCKEKKNCPSGYYFDEDSCRCIQIPKVYKRN